MEGVKRNDLLLLSLALALAMVCSHLTVGMAQEIGDVKVAWPEYRPAVFRKTAAKDVAYYLEISGLVAASEIFISRPTFNQSAPLNPGTDQSVWLYTTWDNSTIYQIPKRGKGHANRLNPGWVELVGKDYKSAIETITKEVIGVLVVYGPVGFIRDEDTRFNRVFLEYDTKGKVAKVPRIELAS